MSRIALGWLLAASVAWGQQQPKRLLYVTHSHSAGFVHGSIGISRSVMTEVGGRSGVEVTSTEDLSFFDAGRLDGFDAVFFFTSGELPLSDARKQNLLSFVRGGKGFGGAHSATDTLYQWPEYGELIGAYFDGHPWTQEATVEIEDPDHPASRGVGTSFRILEEFYQFRSFSRDRVRVLLTLDPGSVDLRAPGVNRTDEDFALAWVRPYGEGRVFYTALGHFDETWVDRRFQTMLEGALRYLTGQAPSDSAPRRSQPVVARVSNLAHQTEGAVSPALLVAITGSGLTTGSSMSAPALPLPTRLAGTQVRVNGLRAGLISVAPERIVAMIPPEAKAGEAGVLEVLTGGPQSSARANVQVEASAPGILGVTHSGATLSVYATGVALPGVEVLANGRALAIEFAGPAPGLAGMQQINARLPDELANQAVELRLRSAGRESALYQQAAQ
jgi:type 1 glutamine amidotransferase